MMVRQADLGTGWLSCLHAENDADLDLGKPRYPAVGLLNVSNSRSYSPMNRTVMLGIILDEQHQSELTFVSLLHGWLPQLFHEASC